jgi:hypothetical protein
MASKVAKIKLKIIKIWKDEIYFYIYLKKIRLKNIY